MRKARSRCPIRIKRVSEIDQRIDKLQKEIERLNEERSAALQVINKAQSDQVKTAIPKVLSRDAVEQLRQMTIQRMRLSDVLLDAKIRARLNLNDEQVKKIQEFKEKGGDRVWLNVATKVPIENLATRLTIRNVQHVWYSDFSGDASRSELLKVLTAQQRQSLERLSGLTFEKSK